jgi:hypothetical protein
MTLHHLAGKKKKANRGPRQTLVSCASGAVTNRDGSSNNRGHGCTNETMTGLNGQPDVVTKGPWSTAGEMLYDKSSDVSDLKLAMSTLMPTDNHQAFWYHSATCNRPFNC